LQLLRSDVIVIKSYTTQHGQYRY